MLKVFNVDVLVDPLAVSDGLELVNVVKLFLFDIDQTLHLVVTILVRPARIISIFRGWNVWKVTVIILFNFLVVQAVGIKRIFWLLSHTSVCLWRCWLSAAEDVWRKRIWLVRCHLRFNYLILTWLDLRHILPIFIVRTLQHSLK